jgi:DNA-binding NarL/FixJ family response regulator
MNRINYSYEAAFMTNSPEQTTRVVIADDRSRSRSALRALLATRSSIEVVAEASDGSEAILLVEEYLPDVVVMDICMPLLDGLTATRCIKHRWPDIKVIILTMYPPMQKDALSSGADVFLVKGCSAQKLISAITEKSAPACMSPINSS